MRPACFKLEKMKELIIIGARGAGREAMDLAKISRGFGTEWIIKGFLDDKKDALDGFKQYAPIIDSVEHYIPGENDVFICPLGNTLYKKKYAEIIKGKGGKFHNLIPTSTEINENVRLGEGVIINAFSSIATGSSIGDMVTVQGQLIIGHDVVVGPYCQLGSFSFIGGYTTLGECVAVNAGSTIIDRITVGDNATIGAGSVVIKNVKAGITVFGNPAREIAS